MTSSSRVSDRSLERARLGELTDHELAELMEQLDADGELDRLDKSIRSDEAFLDKYPAQYVVPLIRNRMERQKREREREISSQKGDKMLSQRAVFSHPIAAALVVAVIAALAFFALQTPTDELAPVAEVNEAETENLVQPAQPAGPFPTFADRIDRRLSPLGELVLTPGEQLPLSARGVKHVEIDKTRVVPPPRVLDNKTKFVFEGGEPGLTGVRIYYTGDQREDLVYVRVLDWHHGTFPDGISARSHGGGLMDCDELAAARDLRGTISVRQIVAPNGQVASSWVESSDLDDDELEACVAADAQTITRPEAAEPSTALIRYTFPISVPDE